MRVRHGSSRARTKNFTMIGIGVSYKADHKGVSSVVITGREEGTDADDGPAGRITIEFNRADSAINLVNLTRRLVQFCEDNEVNWRQGDD